MPKKITTNPKAVEARERKEEKKRVEKERKEEEEENAKWTEDDPNVIKKLQRKQEQERKKLEANAKKAENRALYEEEMAKTCGKNAANPAATKITLTEINEKLEKQKREQEVQREKAEKLAKEKIAIQELPEENVNRLVVEGEEARTVDEAINLFQSVSLSKDDDRHPEKRMKAAYTAFEDKNLPRLKVENPTLRLSQLKQILKKEWMKSPENPLNKLMNSK